MSLVQELPQHFADEIDAVVGDDHDDDGSDTPTLRPSRRSAAHDIDVDPDQFDDDDSSPDGRMGLSPSSAWALAIDYGTSFMAAAVYDGST